MVAGTFSIPLDYQLALSGDTSGDEHSATQPLRFYLAGPENYLLQVVAESFFAESTSFNPLFLFGPTGTGKSALVRGLLARWEQSYPGFSVTLTTGHDFVRHQSDDGIRHNSWIRHLIVDEPPAWFVIDSLDELCGQEHAQNTLCAVFDELVQSGTRLIAISRIALEKLQLRAGLFSRLAAGLVVPVRLPSPTTRAALISQIADARNLQLESGVAQMLANSLPLTFSQLQHALYQVQSLVAPRRRIGPNHVTEYMDRQPHGDRLLRIGRFVATHCHINLRQLRSPSRSRNLVDARGLFIYLALRCYNASLTEIGRFLGGRDHSTISHALKKIELSISRDADFRDTVNEICSQLLATVDD